MKHKISIISFFLLAIFSFINAQKGTKIDGIVAVIGNEIILDSDVKDLIKHARAQGYQVEQKCQFLENILMNKMLLYQAKQDTLIQISKEDVKNNVENMVGRYLEQAGSEKALLEGFGLSTMLDLRTELEVELTNQQYSEQKKSSISKNADITPYELNEFYEKNKDQLPNVKEEISLSHLILYPKLSEYSKSKLIEKLNSMKKDIESGISTFENKAKIYSQDPGSAPNGGLYLNVKRGKMVKEFDAVAFNLEEGKISDPFQTEFGYHIIKLEKRKGQSLDLRHILLESVPNKDEINQAKKKLDSIKTLIKDNKLTFKEAVAKFSDDKYTRFNGGAITNPETAENRIEKIQLSSKELFNLTGVKEKELSDVFEDEYQRKKVVRLFLLNEVIPEHKIDLKTDYAKLKNIALNQKKNKLLEEWIVKQIPSTFITIQKDYKDCNFEINWTNKADFIKKTNL